MPITPSSEDGECSCRHHILAKKRREEWQKGFVLQAALLAFRWGENAFQKTAVYFLYTPLGINESYSFYYITHLFKRICSLTTLARPHCRSWSIRLNTGRGIPGDVSGEGGGGAVS